MAALTDILQQNNRKRTFSPLSEKAKLICNQAWIVFCLFVCLLVLFLFLELHYMTPKFITLPTKMSHICQSIMLYMIQFV